MSLKRLDQWPTAERTKQLLIIGIILFTIFMPLNTILFQQADPEPFYESQLSFNGDKIKEQYAEMTDEELDFYRFVQFFDYLFIISEIILYFSLCLTLARKFEEDTKWRQSGYTAAIIGIIFPICDAIETAFIHLMLTDPEGFPNEWAILHSLFALLKFLGMGIIIAWLIIVAIALLYRRRQSKKQQPQ